jgi:AraC-like DNA-binding protein
VLAYVARSQATVGDALRAFARFAGGAWGADDVVRIAEADGHAAIDLALHPALSRHIVEFLLARTAILLRRSGAPADAAALRHAAAAPPAAYERVLQCPVRFRAAAYRLTLRADDLARPLRTANPEAATALAAGLRQTPARTAPVMARLVGAVDEALARGERIDREALARALGMSGRTLARRLAEEQRGFAEVVDGVRRELAERLIAEPALDIGEIAGRVGFADLAAFGKAFRRWFGVSPTAYRAQR